MDSFDGNISDGMLDEMDRVPAAANAPALFDTSKVFSCKNGRDSDGMWESTLRTILNLLSHHLLEKQATI